ncbi:Fic family protein [Ructibacterium gallinarum]|uniref:Fic family protein n=1 Tax=Ructibacterium gallinarum TaxID=2779355 RepID=A0A9D5M0B1_9FIRM|nr:Fic family protein [Ructibacterium gallinarum]MBE5039113.1 Fic family protein [Ructibacterium gallinarum]
MKYNNLKSLYYESNDIYAEEYLKRFNSEDTVKLNFYIGEHQAFYMENAMVMKIAYKIAKIDKEVSSLCNELPGIAIDQYSKKCLIDEIVITNKIEGVHSSRKEIGEALNILEVQSKHEGKHQRFVGLVNKYLKLIKQEQICLDNCQNIRDIYDEVFLEEILHEDPKNKPDGKIFRKEAVTVHSETDRIIHTGLTPESKIIEAMTRALEFLQDESVDELFRVCIFHYLIEYIHPFYDGNGRLGRFILSYGISKTLTPLISLRISETIKENISTYYKAFKLCNDQRNLGDITPFLLMQLEMIYKAMKELKKSLNEKITIWEKYELAIRHLTDSDEILRLYSLLIQAALFSEQGISMIELQNNMKQSKYMVKKLMRQIPDDMIIVKTKNRYKFYSINLERLNKIILDDSIEAIQKN